MRIDPAGFDPRMFITGPFRACPKCGHHELGTLSVTANVLRLRCRNCFYTAGERLPNLSKSVIYLDQMLLSNIAKELDPVWKSSVRRADPFWVDIFDQLDRLVKLQLIVCPESPIHAEESSFDDRYERILRRLYQHLACGVSLDFPEQVLSRQLDEGFNAVVEGRSPDWTRITPGDVVNGSLNRWTDRLLLTVNMGHWEGEVENNRNSRQRGYDLLTRLWKIWSTEQAVSFQQRFEAERHGLANAAIEAFQNQAQKWQAATVSPNDLQDALELMPGSLVMLVVAFLQRFAELGVSEAERLVQVAQFLHSEPALCAPKNHIEALLYASLARRAASGQKRVPSRGTVNDIQVISAYLPYSKAMFVDDEFAQYLKEQPLAREIEPYPTKIFSTRSREEFLNFLRGIEEQTAPEHLALVTHVYGEDWLRPFREILEDERRKEVPKQGS
jgi:hypothetical protein